MDPTENFTTAKISNPTLAQKQYVTSWSRIAEIVHTLLV